jgi:hypothetical protein
MDNQQNKILWITIKSALKKDIISRKLKDPKIRLGALEGVEELFKAHFNDEYRDPKELLKIDIDSFKLKLGHFKSNGKLNGAEINIVNEIYQYLKLNIVP